MLILSYAILEEYFLARWTGNPYVLLFTDTLSYTKKFVRIAKRFLTNKQKAIWSSEVPLHASRKLVGEKSTSHPRRGGGGGSKKTTRACSAPELDLDPHVSFGGSHMVCHAAGHLNQLHMALPRPNKLAYLLRHFFPGVPIRMSWPLPSLTPGCVCSFPRKRECSLPLLPQKICSSLTIKGSSYKGPDKTERPARVIIYILTFAIHVVRLQRKPSCMPQRRALNSGV